MLFDETEHVERQFEFALPPELTASLEHLRKDAADEASDAPAVPRTLRFSLLGWEKAGGDIVWRGARLLSCELLRRGSSLRGARVLELGAGSGLLGALTAHLGASTVISDGDEGELPLLARNAERFSDCLSLGGSLSAALLEWGTAAAIIADAAASKDAKVATDVAAPPLKRRSFDLVIGSDIVYMPEHIPSLAQTIEFFLADGGEALVANTAVATRTTHPEARALFLASLEAQGLHVEVQVPPDGATFTLAGGEWAAVAYVLRITRPPEPAPAA